MRARSQACGHCMVQQYHFPPESNAHKLPPPGMILAGSIASLWTIRRWAACRCSREKESDEKSAEDIGHSTLTRARELTHFCQAVKAAGKAGSAQDVANMLAEVPWARDDTKMTTQNIRLLCQIVNS